MQRRSLFQALFATGVGVFALPAMAKDHKEWPPSARHDNRRNDPPRGNPHGNPRDDWNDDRRGGPPRSERRDEFRYYNARGDEFRRGRRLPPGLGRYNYVVTDYRRHRLPRPGRHQHWVQVGPDFVLVIAATGLIVNVVIGN